MPSTSPQPLDSAVENHAAALADSALKLYNEHNLNDALRNLKQALSLSPRNPKVLTAFNAIQADSATPEIVRLCRRALVSRGNQAVKAAEEAVRYLKSGPHTRGDTAGEGECLRMFLDAEQGDRDRQVYGGVVAELLRSSGGGRIGAREVLAERIRHDVAHSGREGLEAVLEKMWSCGGAAMEGLVSVLVDDGLWIEKEKEKKERSEVLWVCFKWFISLVEKHGDEEGVKAGLRAITRMLMAKAEDVHHLMSSTVFEQILLAVSRGRGEEGVVAVEGELDNELAAQATLAAAKYVSAAGEVGESQFANFMTGKLVVSEDEKDTIVAMDVAAAIFPLIQQVSAGMFTQTEGFIGRLVEVLDEGERPSEVRNSKHRAEAVRAVVRLLAVACGDKGCRGVIKQSCGVYLERIIARGRGGKRENDTRTLAAVALAKIRSAAPSDDAAALGAQPSPVVDKESIGELAQIFKASLILQSSTSMAAVSQRESVEGLAYTSLDPSVKKALVTDSTFVNALLKTLTNPTAPSRGVLYGGLTVVANITAYLPVLTEEQRKVLQLKSYAEASPSANTPKESDIDLESDEAVTLRCKRLLDADIIPVLVTIFKNISQSSSSTTGTLVNASSSLVLIPKIILSLSKTQKHRPQMAQQGTIKLLLQIYSSVKTNPAKQQQPSPFSSLPPDSSRLSEIKYFAAHALARILVSINPALVFSSQTPPASAIRPLLDLLNTRYGEQLMTAAASRGPGAMTDLLPTFEALLALTNLASMPRDKAGGSSSSVGGVQDLIVRVGWDHLEDLLLMHAPRSSSSAVLKTTQTEDPVSSSGDDVEETGTLPEESKSSARGGENTKSNPDDRQNTMPKKTVDTADASTRIQRAAVELICNLCGSYSPLALAKFAAETQSDPRVTGRLHLLLALADAADYQTRRAAAGALAVLTEFETVVQGVLDRERGVDVVLGMLKDEEDQGGEIALRGVVCVTNLLEVGGEKAIERIKAEGGKEALVGAVNRARGREVVEFGVKAVSMLR